MSVILRAHLVRGESHIQRNANREVATTSPPFYNEPHRSHVLFVKSASGTTFHILVTALFCCDWKPERQVCKASHWHRAKWGCTWLIFCHISLLEWRVFQINWLWDYERSYTIFQCAASPFLLMLGVSWWFCVCVTLGLPTQPSLAIWGLGYDFSLWWLTIPHQTRILIVKKVTAKINTLVSEKMVRRPQKLIVKTELPHPCAVAASLVLSLFGKFGKLYGNRVKFVRFTWKTIYAKYLRENPMFTGCTWAVKFHGSFHPNSTSASMGTISDFAQNCTKCTPVGAMKNPQASDQNSKRFRFYGLLNCKGHNPFLPSWITVFILKGVWKPITSFLYKI